MSSKATQFESLLEAVPDALAGMDQQGMIRFVNQRTESLFGYDRGDLVGEHIQTLVPRFTWPSDEQGVEDSADPGARSTELDRQLNARHRDGTEFPVNIHLSHVGTGDVLLVITAAGEVTTHRQALENSKLLAAIVENSNEAILGKTLDGIVTSWNPAAERLFGYSAEQIIGKSNDLIVPDDGAGETKALLARIGAGLQVGHLETVRVRKDGSAFPAYLTVSPIYDADGAIVGASTIVRDDTARVEAFEAARSMIESSQDSLVAISAEGLITDANEATVKVTGVPREELIGTPFSDYFTDPQKANAIYQELFGDGMAGDYPLAIRHRDGSVTEVLYNASVHRGVRGKVLAVFAAARDVTRLNEALESARSLIESSQDSLVAISPEGLITDLNEATVKVTGVPREELIGTAFSDYFTDPEEANEIYQQVFAQEESVEYPLTLRHRDGTLTEVLYNASVYRGTGGRVLAVFAAARDVTKLTEALELARSMIESSLDSLVAISPEGLITDANQATVNVTGVPRQELIGTAFSDYFTDPDKATEVYQRVFAHQEPVEYLLTIRRRDGTLTEVLYNASVHRGTGGRVLAVFAAARDVTKLMKALEAARSMIESSLDSLVAISAEGMITDANQATVNVTGVPRDELIGTAFSDYFTDPQKANAIYQRVFAQGMAVDYPLTMRHRDGRLTQVLYNASVYRDADGNVLGVFAAARDVTAQMQAQKLNIEQQAKEAERLSELEQFQRLVVGRELKMIELKKEIERLTTRLPSDDTEPRDQER